MAAMNKKFQRTRVTPRRLKNADERSREYLTEDEVEKLIAAASKHEPNGFRNALMIRMAFEHGLRAGEVVDLQWDQLNLSNGTIVIKPLKNRQQLVQSLSSEEIEALKKLPKRSTFVFLGLRGPLFVDAFQLVVKKAGQQAKLGFLVHPHMLRHARDFELANNEDG